MWKYLWALSSSFQRGEAHKNRDNMAFDIYPRLTSQIRQNFGNRILFLEGSRLKYYIKPQSLSPADLESLQIHK